MRALILALALILAPMSAALADNDVGCGVGTEIWKGNKGLPFKLLASSTNGITFQSISVTFGLINCNGKDTVTASARTRHFVSTHLDRIARDAAVSGGESLDALAALLEIEQVDRSAFAALTQRNFEALFPSDHATSNEMLLTLARLLQEDERLSVYVRS
jgi:hypothetical protein